MKTKPMTTNSTQECMDELHAAELLYRHNKWRRGDDEHDMANPKELGVALDMAVAALKARSTSAPAGEVVEADEVVWPEPIVETLGTICPDPSAHAAIPAPSVVGEDEAVSAFAKANEAGKCPDHCVYEAVKSALGVREKQGVDTIKRFILNFYNGHQDLENAATACYNSLIAAGVIQGGGK